MASEQQANQTIALAKGEAKKIMAEQVWIYYVSLTRSFEPSLNFYQVAKAKVVKQNLETQSAAYQKVEMN